MSILVLAEHNNIEIKSSTLNTISAASQIEQEIDVLVTGFECEELAKKIAKCEKVSKVIFVGSKTTSKLERLGIKSIIPLGPFSLRQLSKFSV